MDEVKADVVKQLWYLTAYLTILYFDCERMQWKKAPTMNSMYLQEKLQSFIRQVDRIWWDNFKSGLSEVRMLDMFDSYYMTIWLWWVPTLWVDNDEFYEYMNWEMTRDEFIAKIV